MRLSTVFLVCFSAALPAQVLSLDPTLDSRSGPGADLVPGFGLDYRMQVLIDKSRMNAFVGKTLTGLHLRRDAGYAAAVKAGQAELEVYLSPAARSAADASSLFAKNTGASPVLVFKGKVNLPASKVPTSTVTKPWAGEYLVSIPFGTPYPYGGGDLCVEFRGRPAPGSAGLFWPVDGEYQEGSGSARAFGGNCAKWAKGSVTAYASAGTLRIGSTTWFRSVGNHGAMALFLLGVVKFEPGIDLAMIGAPGCKQYVQPLLMLPLAYHPPFWPTVPTLATLSPQIPPETSLMGQSVVVQFAEDESNLPSSKWSNAAKLSTSNGIELKISSVPPTLGLATIRSRRRSYGLVAQPPVGEVDVSRGPVMRFAYK